LSSNHGRAPQQKHSIREISFLAKMQKMSDDVAESNERNIQLLLNQLTAEIFVNLSDKLFKEIDSVEVLEIVQTTIYDKAVLDQQQNPAPGQAHAC
jgi:myo-inositol-1-phosphate synthase